MTIPRIQERQTMKNRILFATAALSAFGLLSAPCLKAQTVEIVAPVVVKTVPEAGSKDVAPGEMDIKITFSKEMADHSWSWSTAWRDSTPQSVSGPPGAPHYSSDHRTCIMRVKLEPGKTYGWWINSARFHGFRDAHGRVAVPYLLVFHVKGD